MSQLSLTAYQRAVRDRHDLGLFALLWRRQGRKTTTLSLRALREMAAFAGRLVTLASASLLVGREVIFREALLFRDLMQAYAGRGKVEMVDKANGKVPEREDDFADVFSAGRMETRLWHDRTVFSRTIIIAPNPATARGFSGTTFIDEIGFIRDFKDVWEAMEPIFSADPTFRCILATTPPADDRHFSHELLAAAPGAKFAPCAEGHWYRSEGRIMVHRVDVHDAAAAGVKLYHPETRAVVAPEEHRSLSLDREAWDRNYALIFAKSGTAACGLLDILRAQSRPESALCVAEEDAVRSFPEQWESDPAGGSVGLGLDLATTENEVSNPSSLAVVQEMSGIYVVRLLLRWKTSDPEVTRGIVRRVLDALSHKRGLDVDATNERFFATDLRTRLAGVVAVRLIIASENTLQAGQEVKMKTALGNRLVAALEDGRLALPQARWVKDDLRLVRKEKGLFVNDTDSAGNHGDAFDAIKLALNVLATGGPCFSEVVQLPGSDTRAWMATHARREVLV